MRSNPKTNRTTRRRRAALSAALSVAVEPVERRTLMSVAPAPVLANGVLTVTGTTDKDAISVNYNINPDGTDVGTFVTVNGTTYDYTGQTVTQVVVNALDGDDGIAVNLLTGGPAVSVNGGAGNDSVGSTQSVSAGTIVFDGGDGNDTLLAFDGQALMSLTMYGGAGDDACYGGYDVQTYFDGGAGNDYDEITYLTDPNTFLGGSGTDTLVIAPDDQSPMTVKLDGLADSQLYDTPNSRFGADIENLTFKGLQENNVTVVGDALDNVIAVPGYGTINVDGGGGNDTITATGNALTLRGGPGNDRLTGRAGNISTSLYDGGDGNDTLTGGNADGAGSTNQSVQHFVGGPGVDVVDYSAYTSAVTVHLDGTGKSGTAQQVADGGGDTFDGTVENAVGGSGNDVLFGTKGNNALSGNGGADTIVTAGGSDTVNGGAGNDTVYADDGAPTSIDGGADNDTAYIDPTGDTTVNVETVVKRKGGVVVGTGHAISGTVFLDVNGNGVREAGDNGLGGQTVYLDLNGDATLDNGEPSAVTGSTGAYTINTTLTGPVTVRQVGRANYRQSFPATHLGMDGRTVTAGADPAGVDFGQTQRVLIAGTVTGAYTAAPANGVTVYVDANGNGKRDAGEPSTVTANGGRWEFDSLFAGTNYPVRFVVPAGYQQVDPAGNGAFNVDLPIPGELNGDVFLTLAPAGSPTLLPAATFGTAGSYNNLGNTVSRATDRNADTYFDAPVASGAFVGLDLGAAGVVSQIGFIPAGLASRMVGGVFQASNDAAFGKAVTVYTVTAAPAQGSLTLVKTNTSAAYRYWRYVGPANGYCNIAEFQLFK